MAAARRPNSADDLGLRRALSDRLLPLLVGAMVFLAALALAGALAAAGLAAQWQSGAASMLTVTVPMPDVLQGGTRQGAAPPGGTPRAQLAAQILATAPGIASARRLTDAEIVLLLKPWLGEDPATLSLRLPAVFEVRLAAAAPDPGLAARLSEAVPGTQLEHNGEWLARLADLVRSLQACATLALLVVAVVAAAVVGVATRAGLAVRRDAIEIVHGLGATDHLIASQFSHRITMLVLSGALAGLLLVLPVLMGLASLAAPFQNHQALPSSVDDFLAVLPPLLWALLAALPLAAGIIGWATAQATVRGWLRQLP
jgi:cell division transport system permease protein